MLSMRAGLAAVATYTTYRTSDLDQQRAGAVRRLAQQLPLAHADDLAVQIRARTAVSSVPLTHLCGINLLTAGTLAGILGPGQRVPTETHLAAYVGVAPLEASSAGATDGSTPSGPGSRSPRRAIRPMRAPTCLTVSGRTETPPAPTCR
jgi:transposase